MHGIKKANSRPSLKSRKLMLQRRLTNQNKQHSKKPSKKHGEKKKPKKMTRSNDHATSSSMEQLNKNRKRITHGQKLSSKTLTRGSPSKMFFAWENHHRRRNAPYWFVFPVKKKKTTLLGNLPSLRGIQKYKAVSITKDLTPDERKNLKKLSDQAKEKNKTESSEAGKWRVRGNSKNGFFLIKIQSKIIRTEKKQVVFANNLTQIKEF